MSEIQKSPTLQIKETLDELSALSPEASDSDYRHILLSRIGSVFETHPDLRKAPNPIAMRAMSLLAHEEQARAGEVLYRTKTLDQIAPVKGDLYERLPNASKEVVDQLLLDLLNDEMKGVTLDGPEHLAELANISLNEARGAYGTLDGIDTQPGVVTYSLVDLEETPAEATDRKTKFETSDSRESEPYVLSKFYFARTHRDEEGHVMSVVLETIPYVPKNAVYVLRNDEGHWQNGINDVTNKPDTRRHGAVRRVYHTKDKDGNLDHEGVIRRINKLLVLPFDKFNQ